MGRGADDAERALQRRRRGARGEDITRQGALRPAAALSFLALLAFGARGLGYSRCFHNGRVFFFGSDSWYHMRRIEFAVAHDLRLPGVDPYLNFPEGGATLWGSLFDRLAAAAAVLSGAAYRGPQALEIFCAWLPAVLGALCVLPLFALGRRLFGPAEGLAAAAFLALLPGHVQYTMLGNLDHHVLESLLFCAASAALLRLRRGAEVEPLSGRARALGAAALIWLLFLTHPAVSCVYLGALWLAAAASDDLEREAPWAFLLPAAALLPWAATGFADPAGVSRLSATPSWLMYERHSLLQPLLLAFCGCSLLARRAVRESPRSPARVAGLSLATGVLLAVLLWPLAAGAGELFKRDPWLQYIAETRPLLVPSPERPPQLLFAAQMFGWLYFAFPAWWLWSWRRGRDGFLAAWSGALFLLVNIQLRFMPVFSCAMALALAQAALAGWRGCAGRPALRRGAARAGLALILLAASWPCLSWLRSLGKGSRFKYLTLSDQFYDMCLALRQNSPPTEGYQDADGKPAYGVIAPWDLGHAIVYLARRPVVADPFGHGLRRSYGYYAAARPQEALAELKDVRYVVAQDLSDALTHRMLSEYLRLPPEHPLRQGRWRELFGMKLLLGEPMKDASGRPTTWGHRLVYRSEDGRESLYEVDQPLKRL